MGDKWFPDKIMGVINLGDAFSQISAQDDTGRN